MIAGATATRRTAILDAALATFLEHGIAAAPIEAICERSGASVGSVYHHFGDKAGLAGAVYADALADYGEALRGALRAHPDDAEGGVRAGVRAHLRWCLRDQSERARFLLFHGDAARGAAADTITALNRDLFDEVLRWWRPHARYGVLRDLDLDLAYALWLGPAQEFCRLRLGGRTPVAPKKAASALADGAWLSLRNHGEGRS